MREAVKDLYIDLWQRYPDHILHNNQIYKENCQGCVHFTSGLMYGIVPSCGCRKFINLDWALKNECDEGNEKQTTLLDILEVR